MSIESLESLLEGESVWSQLGAEDFRALAADRLFGETAVPAGDFLMNPDFEDWVYERAVKPAAVLIGIVPRSDELTVILTKRTDKLSAHSSQIAFAGGKIDANDDGPEAAALREAQEEIALSPEKVDVIGTMPEYFTGSGYRISPVVALVDPQAEMSANPDEVEYIFEVPLAFLMDDDNHHLGSREFGGKTRYYLEMPFGEHYIWGVTAGIIRVFHDRLKGVPEAEAQRVLQEAMAK